MLRWWLKRKQISERRRKDVVLAADRAMARWGDAADAECWRKCLTAIAEADGFRLEHWTSVRREIRRRHGGARAQSRVDTFFSPP